MDMLAERLGKRLGAGASLILVKYGALCPGRALAAEEQSARPVTFEGAVAHYKSGDLATAEREFLFLTDIEVRWVDR